MVEGKMKKLITLLLSGIIIAFGDQFAITDNDIKVLLKDNGTWHSVVLSDSTIKMEVSPFATTDDSQIVFLKDGGKWEYLIIPDSLVEIISDTTLLSQDQSPTEDIVFFGELDKKPKPISIPAPKYPEKMRRAGIEGTVTLKVLVDIDGTVTEIRVHKSSGYTEFDQAAINALRKAKFEPAEHKGDKVKTWTQMPFFFRLR